MRTATRTCFTLAVVALCGCTETTTRTPTTPAARRLTPDEAKADAVGIFDPGRQPLAGGATTIFDTSPEAFEQPAPNLTAAELAVHEEGDEAFEEAFTPENGLGPVFDNVSCEGCHVGDGRGRPPLPGEAFESLLFRSSIAGRDAHGGPVGIPGFGGQLQLRAIPGVEVELAAAVTYTEVTGSFADGSTYSLRVPRYTFTTSYEPLPSGFLFSPRAAPSVNGLGLLEAISARDLLLRADPDDRNRDGISGRVNIAWDAVQQRYAIGRFGWKAAVPSLSQQVAGAYNGDMGITSPLFRAESCEGDRDVCARHAEEVSQETVDAATFYVQTLGVPARRDVNDFQVRRGEAIFFDVGCAKCHTPTFTTATLPGVPAVSNQTIHPYTDLLVHDMGSGLADNRPDFGASGREFRTAPLWGLGLIPTVNGHNNLMHDGRARGPLEAILWHGGEGARARENVKRLPASQRAALVRFLNSL